MVVAQRFLYSNGFCISSESPWRSCAWTCIKGCHEKQEEERKSHALFYVLSATRFFISWYLLKMLHVARFYSKRAAVYMGQWLLFCFCFVLFFYLKLRRWGQGRGGGEEYRPLPSFPSHAFPRRDGEGMWLSLPQNFCFFLLCIRQEIPKEQNLHDYSLTLKRIVVLVIHQISWVKNKNKKRHFRTLFTFWYCLQIISAVLWFCANSLWK